MGIIKALKETIGGSFADQWLEVVEPENMGGQTVMTCGIRTGKGANKKGGKDVISNGSVIHVNEGQFMMLVDGGKIVDYSAEPGYFTVDNSSMPSMFSGNLDDVIKNSFDRFRFGGITPTSQKVYYLNLQEIKGIKFGTRNPINYFDNFYNAELFLRAHGTYSIRITDPIRFFVEAIPKNRDQVEITDINEQYLYEFLDALQSSINQMSADGVRISYVASKSRELSKYMAETLDEDWKQNRGMEIQAVGIASVSYDETSQKLINMRNQGAMLGDPSVREGYMQGAFARGIEAAGRNPGGSTVGFMGLNMGAQMGGNMASSMSAANMQQMQMNQAAQRNQMQQNQGSQPAGQGASQTASRPESWICGCGHENTGKFCSECGKAKPEKETWTCACGHENTGKFCSECGKPRPAGSWVCECGHENTGKFCSECGKSR
ncbi:MAG: SPFH domain-containing protein [Clostridiales bacterium]|nr:SPFH domain-containing protein [Clostridiales bacterium]